MALKLKVLLIFLCCRPHIGLGLGRSQNTRPQYLSMRFNKFALQSISLIGFRFHIHRLCCAVLCALWLSVCVCVCSMYTHACIHSVCDAVRIDTREGMIGSECNTEYGTQKIELQKLLNYGWTETHPYASFVDSKSNIDQFPSFNITAAGEILIKSLL